MKTRTTTAIAAAALLCGVTAASAGEGRTKPAWAESLLPLGITLAASDQAAKDADDTGRNVRDRDDRTLTPTDQGGSEADRGITAHIRREIVANDELSTDAHNVKIITVDGVVTLRGPVETPAEKAAVAAAAQKAPGVKRVDNQLEVERN